MPIIFVVQYLWNHRLLHTFTSPVVWQTIDGGARQYVSRILNKINCAFVHKQSAVDKIIRQHDHMTLCRTDRQGRPIEEDFAHVIFATHLEEILRMLGEGATEQERDVLKMFHLTAEKHILNLEKVAGLADKEVLATMNPSPLKMPRNQFKSFKFKHPAYDALTLEAQARFDKIQGHDRVWYAGAWMGHGFHPIPSTRTWWIRFSRT
ncbi:hypothetical protein BDV12DRAFT_204797 [Aspergillus spectabilis]